MKRLGFIIAGAICLACVAAIVIAMMSVADNAPALFLQ
jgi:hypothetical protein